MIRGMTLLWALLAVIAGVAMFMVKYEVQALEDDLRKANRQIRADREQIHVLQAEWAYLNEPGRLRDLAEKHLGLKTFEPGQVITLAGLPPRRDPAPGAGETMVGQDSPLPSRKPQPPAAPRRGSELASTKVSP